MQVNVKKFLEESGITEPFYPGKRLVHALQQAGEFKSHCVVLDWRDPGKIRIEVKAGLSGKDLEPSRLKYYPVMFQTPTYVDIEIVNDNRETGKEDEEEGTSGKGSGSSGSGGLKKKTLDGARLMAANAFGAVVEGKVPELGRIAEMVVMGTKLAEQAYAGAMEKLAHGIAHLKVSTTDMLSQAGKFITKYTPPAFMKPTGDETATYKYDRQKNADIGYKPGMG